MNINSLVQWAGTACFMCMYSIMSFRPDLHGYSILAGFCGGLLYMIWSLRVRNWPQTLTNSVSITICAVGLFKTFG
jgi:hypothetical protein